ncbi:MAG: Asp-tRNA(Asn) amidotransferase GatCAB subunit C [Euryarchaeota archaeon]|nr:Asp-tRNA(Asn) amidotransferase GatCAB subunit C [Euryarchaeota archaeon]
MEEKVRREAERVLKELSEALGEIDLEETYYVVEEINITRADGEPELREGLRRAALEIAPKRDEEGYYIAEVGGWVA